MKTPLLASLLLFLTPALLTAQDAAPPTAPPASVAAPRVKHLKAAEAAQTLADAAKTPEKAIHIIDVRTPEEFAEGHIKGAHLVDIASPDFKKNLAALDPAKTYLVHCASGGRSTRSLSILKQLGFQSILHLDGGFNSWKAAGLPLESSAPVR